MRAAQGGTAISNTVLFICEHGSAKSVVAAAHFNRLAAQQGIALRAISRGTDPDAEMHPVALAGLRRDGLEPTGQPRQLVDADLQDAARVVAFGELPAHFPLPASAEIWTVPPVSENYELSRDSVVERVRQLLQGLEPQPSMNRRAVERYLDGFRRSDHKQILECLTDDVEWTIPGAFHLVGKAAFDAEIENPAFVGSPIIETRRIVEEADVVVVEGTVSASKADGGTLNLVFCDVFVMRAGSIRHLTSYLMELK